MIKCLTLYIEIVKYHWTNRYATHSNSYVSDVFAGQFNTQLFLGFGVFPVDTGQQTGDFENDCLHH